MEWLAARGLVHRDLKLANVLVAFDEAVKVADFGLTRPQAACQGEVAGTTIPAGSMVHVRFAAANRDPAVFPDPDVPGPDRPTARRSQSQSQSDHGPWATPRHDGQPRRAGCQHVPKCSAVATHAKA